MNAAMLELLPPPPPWRKQARTEADESAGAPVLYMYINDLTGEQSDTHPLLAHLQKEKGGDDQREDRDEGKDRGGDEATSGLNEERTEEFSGGEHLDFRCEWKEIGLKGNIMSYGITLKYFVEDKHFELVFDGVDATWKYSKLDGKYGPVDKYDLFIGSQISLFGRHLSISSTNSDICRMIDNMEKKMKKKRAYLQEKIEMLGVIPVVKRVTQDRVRNITRSSSKTGHGNLRQLQNEVLKLSEQMGDLGLAHLIK